MGDFAGYLQTVTAVTNQIGPMRRTKTLNLGPILCMLNIWAWLLLQGRCWYKLPYLYVFSSPPWLNWAGWNCNMMNEYLVNKPYPSPRLSPSLSSSSNLTRRWLLRRILLVEGLHVTFLVSPVGSSGVDVDLERQHFLVVSWNNRIIQKLVGRVFTTLFLVYRNL